jgi:hypothetical protein
MKIENSYWRLGMPTSVVEFDASAVDVTVDSVLLRVALADGREIAAPIEWFPRLRDATPEQRNAWELIGGGYGIHWEDIDEDISVPSLLRRN